MCREEGCGFWKIGLVALVLAGCFGTIYVYNWCQNRHIEFVAEWRQLDKRLPGQKKLDGYTFVIGLKVPLTQEKFTLEQMRPN